MIADTLQVLPEKKKMDHGRFTRIYVNLHQLAKLYRPFLLTNIEIRFQFGSCLLISNLEKNQNVANYSKRESKLA